MTRAWKALALPFLIAAFACLAQSVPAAPILMLSRGGGVPVGGGGGEFLSWDPESSATGYTVFWGTVSGPPYANSDDVGNVTSIDQGDLSGLTAGTKYFAIASYDESGLHGPYGTEIVVVVP